MAAAKPDDSDRFYDSAFIQTIHLDIGRRDFDRMQRALPRRISVPGTFRWNDETMQPVGARYKGNSSSAPDSPFKRSFLISVVQRCVGSDCTDFMNAIGQGGNNTTTATDRQVHPGMTSRYRVYAVFPTPRGPRGTGVSNVVPVRVPD